MGSFISAPTIGTGSIRTKSPFFLLAHNGALWDTGTMKQKHTELPFHFFRPGCALFCCGSGCYAFRSISSRGHFPWQHPLVAWQSGLLSYGQQEEASPFFLTLTMLLLVAEIFDHFCCAPYPGTKLHVHMQEEIDFLCPSFLLCKYPPEKKGKRKKRTYQSFHALMGLFVFGWLVPKSSKPKFAVAFVETMAVGAVCR